MVAAASKTKPVKLKAKTEQGKRLDEIKALALRQGYVTEDQVVWLLDDDNDPDVQVEQMEEIHSMLGQMHIEVFASEEDAQERIKKLRKIEDKKPSAASKQASRSTTTMSRAASTSLAARFGSAPGPSMSSRPSPRPSSARSSGNVTPRPPPRRQ